MTARFVESYGGFGGFGLCVVGDTGFGLCVVVGVPGREGAVVPQAADELPPLGGGRRGSGTRGHGSRPLPLGGGRRGSGTRGPGPRPLNSHVKGITLKIGSPPASRAARRGLGPTANPKLPALTILRYPARVQLLSAKEIGQESPGRSTTGQMLIWQKRYTGGLCKTLRSRPLQHVCPGQRVS